MTFIDMKKHIVQYVVLLAILFFTIAAVDLVSFVSPLHSGSKFITFTIQPGENLSEIAANLERSHLLKHPSLWTWMLRLSGEQVNLKAGTYRFREDTTLIHLTELFVEGKSIEYRFTIVPGSTFKEILASLRKTSHLADHLIDDNRKKIISMLGGPKGMSPEGWFYPDTYYYSPDTRAIDILKRAYLRMRGFLKRSWNHRKPNLPLKNAYQALILASLVEKEVSSPKLRLLVASVFINRLRHHMPLQSDPTVIYALGDQYHGQILPKDLHLKSPYNTYTHVGLPPTPIAIPNPADILAVLHPPVTTYYFFVATKGNHYRFSNTFSQHKKAIQKYILTSGKAQ